VRQRTVVEVLAAIAMTERVSGFLASYDERDDAIDSLISDVSQNRLRLVDELRERLLRPTAPMFARSPS
jgi:hypothetical protein